MGIRWKLLVACMTAVSATGVEAKSKPLIPFMTAGEVADAPTGFDEMCIRDAALCDGGIKSRGPVDVAPLPMRATPVQLLNAGFALQPAGMQGCARFADPSATGGAFRYASSFFTSSFAAFMPRSLDCAIRAESFAAPSTALITPDSPHPKPIIQSVAFQDAPDVVVKAAPEPDAATLARMIKRVNSTVNHNVVQVSDMSSVGLAEFWQRAGSKRGSIGDCEDIAIEKRVELLEAGFPASRMFLAAAFSKRYGMHTVLIARLDTGDVVLDSLSAKIVPWSKAPYVFVRRQSIDNPRVWRRIGNANTQQMAAADTGMDARPIS